MESAAAKKRSGKALGRLFGGTVFFLFTLLSAAIVCLTAVLLHSFDVKTGPETLRASDFEVSDDASVSRIVPGESSDLGEIRAICGFPLPYFPGQLMYAGVTNADWDGGNAVRVTMEYASGAVIEAVRPAEAAPLIRRAGMEVQLYGNLRVPFTGMYDGIGAVMCRGNGASCLYFSTDTAAYSVYAPVSGDVLYKYVGENGLSVR